MKYLKLLRVHHYIKNLLVFLPLICSGALFDSKLFFKCCIGFVSFCLISSAVYIVNDICDIEKDREHPSKKNRPIASGAVSLSSAKTVLFVLIAISLLLNIKFPLAGINILVYLIANLGYSYKLKNIPIADVAIIAAGFIIRILYGASITSIEPSPWLLLTITAGALYMALGKRRNELKRNGDASREVLGYYTENFLNSNMYMCLGLTIAFYALWSINAGAILTTPLVILIAMVYSLSVERDSDGDPVEVLLHNKPLIVMCLIYAVLIIGMIYEWI